MAHEADFVDECYAGKDLSLLKKLTLVIPTFNRNYLKRCLWYHAHFPFGQIIVADSSFDEKKIENREIIAKIREEFGANILYLEYQPETEKYGGDIYRKWGDAVQHAETEYSIICVDKAFIYITALIERIDFLDTHIDYVSAQGTWHPIDKDSAGKLVCHSAGYLHPPLLSDSEDIVVRYSNATRKLNYQTFSLFRTEIHKKIYTPITSGNITDIRYGEIALSLFPLLWGKYKYFPNDIDVLRDISALVGKQGLIKSESSSERYPVCASYKKIGVLDQFYSDFENAIINQYNQSATVPSSEIISQLQQYTKTAFYEPINNPGFSISTFIFQHELTRNVLNKLKGNYIPKSVKRITRKIIYPDVDDEYIVDTQFTRLCIKIIENFNT